MRGPNAVFRAKICYWGRVKAGPCLAGTKFGQGQFWIRPSFHPSIDLVCLLFKFTNKENKRITRIINAIIAMFRYVVKLTLG